MNKATILASRGEISKDKSIEIRSKALSEVLRRIPVEDKAFLVNELRAGRLVPFFPDNPRGFCYTHSLPLFSSLKSEETAKIKILHLDYRLEKEPIENAILTIAHEFAHAVLGDEGKAHSLNRASEKRARKKVLAWGFRKEQEALTRYDKNQAQFEKNLEGVLINLNKILDDLSLIKGQTKAKQKLEVSIDGFKQSLVAWTNML